MKIGIVTEYFYPTLGGITENIYHFSKELLRGGHDFRIITGFGGEPTEIDPEVRERIVFLGRSIPVFFNKSCGRATVGMNISKRMTEILTRERFDLIHVHSPMFPTLPIIATLQTEVPVVGTFHTCTGTDLFYYRLFRGRAQKVLDRMAGRIAVSDCCARENQRAFAGRFDVIPNGVDVRWWREGAAPFEKFDDGKTNILFLGRPDPRNGLETLIRAFAVVHHARPRTRLVIVGDGPLRFYFERLVPPGLRGDVCFEGLANGARPRYLASAHIFCFLPTIASFGITILEGMSAGKAIVASDIEAFRDLLVNGESALLVPPDDEERLAFALVRLIDDAALRARLGAAAAAHVERYDWSHVARMHVEYYEGILKRDSGLGIRDSEMQRCTPNPESRVPNPRSP